MSSSSRPQYVPSRRKRQQNERFHGAFSGGFSAGYFNTVGSKEGWKPRGSDDLDDDQSADDNDDILAARPFRATTTSAIADNSTDSGRVGKKRTLQQQQKFEDFMDEMDHEEWGGPQSLRKEYSLKQAPTNSSTAAASANGSGDRGDGEGGAMVEEWMKIIVEAPTNVGNRLLRRLGWREGSSSAFVESTDKNDKYLGGEKMIPEETMVLKKKKMRKILLQQKRVKIPPPKLDICGLGYEPFLNAPEFRKFKEERRKLAQQRAKLGGAGSNVYRINDVLSSSRNNDSTSGNGNRSANVNESDDVYVNIETVEDFVGKKSVGGFALHDDADDAYDDEGTTLTKASEKVALDTEKYNSVVFEHSSSSDDENGYNAISRGTLRREGIPRNNTAEKREARKNGGDDISGALSSFADTGSSSLLAPTNPTKVGRVAADGRPPLASFVLGGAFASASTPKRYPGPDVPLSYQMTRHAFGRDENPMLLKALSRAAQLEAVDENRRRAVAESLRTNAFSNAPSRRLRLSNDTTNNTFPGPRQDRPQAPMAGAAFLGLAEAMKDRFTSVIERPEESKIEGGLRVPTKRINGNEDGSTSNDDIHTKAAKTAEKQIKITRTSHAFAPHRLICKRFQIPPPVSSTGTMTGVKETSRVTEASYFRQEILNPAAASAVATHKKEKNKNNSVPKSQKQSTVFNEDGTLRDDAVADGKELLGLGGERPPVEMYKSIFEPPSEDDDEDLGSEEEVVANNSASIVDRDNPRGDARKTEKETESHSRNSEANKYGSVSMESGSSANALVHYNGPEIDDQKQKSKSKKRRRDRKRSKLDPKSASENEQEARRRPRKRARSLSSESTDLSRDSNSSYNSKDRKRHRGRKSRSKKSRKKDKKSKKTRKH